MDLYEGRSSQEETGGHWRNEDREASDFSFAGFVLSTILDSGQEWLSWHLTGFKKIDELA